MTEPTDPAQPPTWQPPAQPPVGQQPPSWPQAPTGQQPPVGQQPPSWPQAPTGQLPPYGFPPAGQQGAYQMPAPVPPPRKNPVALIVGVVALLAVIGVLAASRNGNGNSRPAVAPSTATSIDSMSLKAGDCISSAQEGEAISSVPLISCGSAHAAEVFYAEKLTIDTFPGVAAIQTQADELCGGPRFTEFVGVPEAESELGVYYMTPTDSSWKLGDREITCLVTPKGKTVTGSLRGANK